VVWGMCVGGGGIGFGEKGVEEGYSIDSVPMHSLAYRSIVFQ